MKRRLSQHQTGTNVTTKPYRPFNLFYQQEFETHIEAYYLQQRSIRNIFSFISSILKHLLLHFCFYSMKKIALLALILPVITFAQKIDHIKIDKVDSVHTLTKSKEKLTSDLSFSVLQVRFLKASYSGDKTLSLFFYAPAKMLTSRNSESYVGVEFTDGTVKKYMNTAPSKVFATGDDINLYFSLPDRDDLISKPIKSIRLSTENESDAFEIKDKDTDMVKNAINLLQDYKE